MAGLPVLATEHIGNPVEFLVECPKGKSGQDGRSKEMNVKIAQSLPHEVMSVYEGKRFLVLHETGHWQSLQKREYHAPILEVSTCQLADDKWVTSNLPVIE